MTISFSSTLSTKVDDLLGTSSSAALFELWAGPFRGGDLLIASFRGREEISRPFSFDILALAQPDADLLDTLLGQPATLVIQNPGKPPRVVAGLIASVEPDGSATSKDRLTYRLRVVPRLFLLKWRTVSRIFQGMSVPDIVAAVLAEAAIPVIWRLSKSYPARSYCLQHQESDYDFVERLLAEEGIFYSFEHPSASIRDLTSSSINLTEKVVFGDSADSYPAIGDEPGEATPADASPELTLRAGEGMRAGSDDDLQKFLLKRAIRSDAVLLCDYDFRRPLLDLRAEAALGANGITSSTTALPTAVAGGPGSTLPIGTPASFGPSGLRAYGHRGEFDDPEVTPARARVELEQRRRSATAGEGSSTCRRLIPGSRFSLVTNQHPALVGEYVITRVDHEGQVPELSVHGSVRTYTNRFRCIPASVPFRPKKPRPKLRQVLESATVVGPEGQEIYTDEHGRIKVQFHWDLDGRRNEQSSCWIRVVQAWSGVSWGFQFVPRVGMEVMVTFLGGDQDTPIIVGCTYNATHPPPFSLPGEKTRSGIRTRSTPGGSGFNELSFEDRQGSEQIRVIAQRDLDEAVAHDHTRRVGFNESISIGRHRSVAVGGDHTETVAGSRSETVSGNAIEAIIGARVVTVIGPEQATVQGDASKVVKSQMTLAVDGEYGVTVGTTDKAAKGTLDVHGDYTIGASGSVRIVAERSIRLSCGDSHIEITPDEIKLEAKALTLLGSKSVSMEGKGPSLHLTDEAILSAKTITIKASQSSLRLDKEAKLRGNKVLLNCDEPEELDEEGNKKPKPKSFRVLLHDDFHKPYANKKYKLLVEGKVLEGETDGDGQVEQDVAPEAASADLTLWLEEPEKDPRLRWRFSLAELPPLDTPHGVRRRLNNLGYLRLAKGQSGNVMAEAIRAFQRDYALELTGALDGATKAMLEKVHGH